MKSGYEDILALAAGQQQPVSPQWWDENGVPRFVAHDPHYCPNIYANEVVLLEIACQRCERRQPVQMCSSSFDEVRARMMNRAFTSLATQIETGVIHYGDPPHHHHERGGFCHAGCTMNCYDLRVIEFWRRDTGDWTRVPELEIALPDAKDLDVATRWPYGTAEFHEPCCRLHTSDGRGTCDCKASDASDTKWGRQS
jgi:hypothetical protein